MQSEVDIEKRLEILEAEVASLKRSIKLNDKPWYKQIPKFGGNAAYEEAMKLGREYRESLKENEDAE